MTAGLHLLHWTCLQSVPEEARRLLLDEAGRWVTDHLFGANSSASKVRDIVEDGIMEVTGECNLQRGYVAPGEQHLWPAWALLEVEDDLDLRNNRCGFWGMAVWGCACGLWFGCLGSCIQFASWLLGLCKWVIYSGVRACGFKGCSGSHVWLCGIFPDTAGSLAWHVELSKGVCSGGLLTSKCMP